MKKLFCLLIGFALMLCSCGGWGRGRRVAGSAEAYWVNGIYSSRGDGLYYVKSRMDKG